ncbi:putative phosphoribosyltransferase [Saccharopolyspora lacisalsi]|uniref:Putative phosphoribosyltransferase n=1 Tax=Halosaccharopolyspora lacisalsi TaxID=1000566 RepID=A0A839DT40_9PSEU|nr:phosphoribosyltransferase family protein [Halosaccharopolyspora lacisalsi]MBA8824674.1 putative phosphoribosyltransferase [Halosaccharopolyspora lacisalsi]
MASPTQSDQLADGFTDRQHAGRVLAEHLPTDLRDPVVFGLARGGVPVAAEVARALGARLRVSVARKIGAPGQPELALGAVTAEGPATYDSRLLTAFHTSAEQLEDECSRERDEARRREQLYQQGPPISLTGRDVVLVDDGLATGATARAALRGVRQSEPRGLFLAVPVGAPGAVRALQEEADSVICVLQPSSFHAVGQWYRRFSPTTDEEILNLLQEFPSD